MRSCPTIKIAVFESTDVDAFLLESRTRTQSFAKSSMTALRANQKYLLFGGLIDGMRSTPPFIDQGGHQARPARLMACTEALSRVGVEVFVKHQTISPVWIRLHYFAISEDGTDSILVASKHRYHAVGVAASHSHQGRTCLHLL